MTTSNLHNGMPAYVCLASRGDRVLAYGHAATLGEAHAWCRQARLVYLEDADQIALASPEEVDWVGAGRAVTMAFVAGWVRTGFSWQTAERCWVRLNFDEIPPGPTSVADLGVGADVPPPSLFALGREIRTLAGKLGHLGRGVGRCASASPAETSRTSQVLLVNEDAVARAAMRALLLPRCEVFEADDFTGALLELAYCDFDVVIAHHRLGTIGSGIELLLAIRHRWPCTRRVLCAENTLELRAAVEAGVAHHVVRHPLDRDTLMAAMATPRRST
jgi:CheY-like chemotaxis protein